MTHVLEITLLDSEDNPHCVHVFNDFSTARWFVKLWLNLNPTNRALERAIVVGDMTSEPKVLSTPGSTLDLSI